MGFYDLSGQERMLLTETIYREITRDLSENTTQNIHRYFSDEDTYIRKAAYQAVGKLYIKEEQLQRPIIDRLRELLRSDDEKVRQTTVNAAGEIGKTDFGSAREFFDAGLFDPHHSVRNAVIGSLKKTGAKNPVPALAWARQYLHHPDKEVRREICHGIELRGRTHPQDILPMLAELQHDSTARVRNTLIHVLGQIAYKKGCLKTVISALNGWENRELVAKALGEIADVHERYKNFAAITPQQAIAYIDNHYKNTKPE